MPNLRQLDKRNHVLQGWLWLGIRLLRLRGQADEGAIAWRLKRADANAPKIHMVVALLGMTVTHYLDPQRL